MTAAVDVMVTKPLQEQEGRLSGGRRGLAGPWAVLAGSSALRREMSMSRSPRGLRGLWSVVPADGAPGGHEQWLMSWLGEGPARHLGGTGKGHLWPLGTQQGCERLGEVGRRWQAGSSSP